MPFGQDEKTTCQSLHVALRFRRRLTWSEWRKKNNNNFLSLFPDSEYLIKTFGSGISNSSSGAKKKWKRSGWLIWTFFHHNATKWRLCDSCVIAWSWIVGSQRSKRHEPCTLYTVDPFAYAVHKLRCHCVHIPCAIPLNPMPNKNITLRINSVA